VVIPKKSQPGKWRLIVDLSSPGGASVNDGIDPQDFSLQYIKVDQVIHMVSCYCPGALKAKFDVESTYRNIPVHPDDRFLLGMRWHGIILGIELDSVNQVACLPEDKLLTLRELIHSWMPRRWCRKWELESLNGHLHHAAKVVWPMTIPFGLTGNFALIFSGGSSFYLLGMELGSGCTLACLLP